MRCASSLLRAARRQISTGGGLAKNLVHRETETQHSESMARGVELLPRQRNSYLPRSQVNILDCHACHEKSVRCPVCLPPVLHGGVSVAHARAADACGQRSSRRPQRLSCSSARPSRCPSHSTPSRTFTHSTVGFSCSVGEVTNPTDLVPCLRPLQPNHASNR